MTSRWQGRVAIAAGAALVAAACGGGEDVDVGDGGGGGELIAGISGEPDQLDPHLTTAYASFQVLENVYDTLVAPDDQGEFQPSLAESWEVSEDQLTWTFTLRDDVTFHDDSEFTAADVVYSYDRIVDDETAVAWRFGSVEDVEATDDHTVVVTLSEPTPNLLDNIGGYKGMAILPENAADDLDLATEANGTGPFELDEITASAVTVTAFENYWGDGPTVDGVEFRFMSESAAALTALSSGEIHWTDNVPPQDIEALEGDDEVVLSTSPSMDYWYLALNQAQEPWDDPDARRGVAYALNREAITEATHFGAATENQTAIPADSFWYLDYSPFEHDVDQARELLDSAEVMEATLAEVGIAVDVQSEEDATWLDRQSEGDFDAFMWSWLGNLDPFGFYHAQHACDGGFNFQGYCNDEVDSLLTQAAVESDQDARKALYDEAATMIVDDASYIYLYNPDVVQAWAPGLDGYQIRPDRAINFENVTLPE